MQRLGAWHQTSGIGSDSEFKDATQQLKAKYRIPKIPTPLKYSRPGKIKIKPRSMEVIPSLRSKEAAPNIWDTTSETFPLPRGNRLTVDDFLEEGRYLHLEIDLGESLPTLEKAFKETVQEWRKLRTPANERKERRGRTTVTPGKSMTSMNTRVKTFCKLRRRGVASMKTPLTMIRFKLSISRSKEPMTKQRK